MLSTLQGKGPPLSVSLSAPLLRQGLAGGAAVVTVDRFFPSSKRCSDCHFVMEELPLSIRWWACPACGAGHLRDLNAARNLAQYAVSSTVSACGGEGSGDGRGTIVKPAPSKQEVSAKAVIA